MVGHDHLLSGLQDHSQLDTSHSVGLLLKGDRQVAETSTWQHTTHKRQTSMLRRDSNPQAQKDSGSTPTPPTEHFWDRLVWIMAGSISSLLWKRQWTFNSHKLWKILLTTWRNFSFLRKITFRGASFFVSELLPTFNRNEWLRNRMEIICRNRLSLTSERKKANECL